MAALPTKEYKKTQPPQEERSHYEYTEQQLRAIEEAIRQLVAAVQQLQAHVSGL